MSDPDFSEFPEPEASLAQDFYDMNKPSGEDLLVIDRAIENEDEAAEAKQKAKDQVAERAKAMTQAIMDYIVTKFDLDTTGTG